MAQWINHLDFSDLWKAHNEGTISLVEMGKQVAMRIKEAHFYQLYIDDFEPIVEDFDHVESIEDFDDALEQLYDWGDIPLDGKFGGKKMCWINTF